MKKISIAIIAILCIMSMLIAFGACQKGGDEDTPSGQPSGNAPSGSVDSGEIPSGSIDSGDIDSGDTVPSGSVDSGDAPSGDQQPELPSGSISSGDVGSGENPPEEEKPKYVESIRDLIENYSEIVYSALTDNFLESAGKAMFGNRTFKAENLISVSWDLGNNDIISEIKIVTTYANNSTGNTYAIGSLILNDAINIKELHRDNIASPINSATATIVKEYSFGYTTTTQEGRGALTKAICDKVFGENASATRYIVDNGQQVDNTLGMQAREFKVVEITDTGIQEISIRIKDASTDEGYIANLEQSKYRTFDEKSYTLSGNKITQ